MAFCSVSLGFTASSFLSPSSSFSVSSSHPRFTISLRLCNSNKPSSFSPNSFVALAQKSTNLSPAAAAAAETVVEESTVEPPPPPVEVQIAAAASAAAETPKAKGEDVFAVVMIGSRQYIVIPGRFLYVQRLKDANVNDMIVLNKVLLVGTRDKAYIGQPVVTNAAVHALVEEQGLDKKVIVYKYKKKKNYRRNIGHRQPNTRIRITGITGYQDFPAETMPETVPA